MNSSPAYGTVYHEVDAGDNAWHYFAFKRDGTDLEAFMDTSIMSHPTLQCAELPIGYAKTALALVDTVVNVVWRDPITEDWSAPIQVDVISEAGNPSMWIDQDNLYVHVVWDEPDALGHGQIWYRRGQFVEQ